MKMTTPTPNARRACLAVDPARPEGAAAELIQAAIDGILSAPSSVISNTIWTTGEAPMTVVDALLLAQTALTAREEAPELALEDAKAFGVGFIVDGQRVSPDRVTVCRGEEAPAEAGGRDYPAEFEAWWATYRHRNRDVADYSVKKQIAFDAFYFGARAQPQAREEAQPVPEGVIVAYERNHYRFHPYKPRSEQFRKGIKGRWQKMNEYGHWENSSPPSTTTPPAPEAEKMRVAVEALEEIKSKARPWASERAAKALAALQQEGRPDA